MNHAYALQPQPHPLGTAAKAPKGVRSSLRQLTYTYLFEIAVIAAMVFRFVPEPYNIFSFLILSVVAFMGRTGTMFALATVWFVYSVNPGFAAEAPLGSGARYLVIAAAVVAAAFRGVRHSVSERVSVATATAAAVACAIIAHSSLFSVYPMISVFKAVLWGTVAVTLVSTLRGMNEREIAKLHRFLLLLFAIIVITGLMSMPFPEARLKNNVGLQGLLNHPQMYGVVCALAGAYFFGTAIASPKPSWLALGLVVLSLQGVVESGARTGGFALILGCVGLVGLTAIRSAAAFRQTLPGLFSGRFAVLTGAAIVASVFNSDVVQQTTAQFVSKNSNAQEVTTAYDTARGFIIRDMMDNIQRRPIQGIGLGVQSATHLIDVEIDEATGLPISAPVEKGVMWIAVFEELGLILGAIVFGWILWGTARSIRMGAAAAAASIAYFFTNFAEATFFSPGAVGLLGLLIFFMGIARGEKVQQPAAPALVQPPLPAAWSSTAS